MSTVPDRHGTVAVHAQSLAAHLGAARADWTADDLVRLFRDRALQVVSLLHVGGDGHLKTLDFVPRDFTHLRAILHGGERADGSSLFADTGLRGAASDIALRPRLDTAFLDPFSEVPTLALLCAHHGRDGAPLPESPDTIVRRAAARVRDVTGCELWAHGEVEYFLGGVAPSAAVVERADRGYHATSPWVFGQDLRRHAMAILTAMGVPLKYGHSEVGYIGAHESGGEVWEQHEIELALAPLAHAADAIVLTQWVLENLAARAGQRCSFAPIVREGHAGSGLHIHLSAVRDGAHDSVLRDDGSLTDAAAALVAGLVDGGAALMAFGNRVPASFVRLTQGKEAPAGVTWGASNRHALVRIPFVARDADGFALATPTVEFRLADGSAHPHLLLAGIAQTMCAGAALDASARDALLAATHANGGAPQIALPRTAADIAAAVERSRATLDAGGVFPAGLALRES